MSTPELFDLQRLPDDDILQDRRNGQGYWLYLPKEEVSAEESWPSLKSYDSKFKELPKIIELLESHGSVLLVGDPGSGKSHFVQELQSACLANYVPVFCLKMHINGGKGSGIKNIQTQLETFKFKAKETGRGLVILDNIDSIGYKGKSRRRGETRQYVCDTLEALEGLTHDQSIAVFATAHDESWRLGRWTWHDQSIDQPAQKALEKFPVQWIFQGRVALSSLVNILRFNRSNAKSKSSNIDSTASIGQAAYIIRMLYKMNRADFCHANLIDARLFLQSPSLAIQEIDNGKQVRRGEKI